MPIRPTLEPPGFPMFILRYLFKTVILGLVIKLLGRFFPILLRLLRLWR